MRQLLSLTLLCTAAGCATGNQSGNKPSAFIGLNSFALAARYGTPTNYQCQRDDDAGAGYIA
ncbi:hypothetical protein [Janthinobacterium sp. LM6]|uniref:hypothetical protein n=1 Tax=Janthinobacterium sp. LM6 TaxID=1938606 RepID=UPI00123751AE|nr:hypothetical protein [Janthinobacterium sp. LM6]